MLEQAEKGYADERKPQRGNRVNEVYYRELEEFARWKIRQHLQDLLEQEVSEWLEREKNERKANPMEQPGFRNGYGKKRRFTLSLETVEIRRVAG